MRCFQLFLCVGILLGACTLRAQEESASFPGAALGGMDAFRGQFPGPGQLVLLPLRNGIGAFQKPSLSVPVSVTPGEMKAVSPVTFMTETSWRDLPTGVLTCFPLQHICAGFQELPRSRNCNLLSELRLAANTRNSGSPATRLIPPGAVRGAE